jgi:hypothetical protein
MSDGFRRGGVAASAPGSAGLGSVAGNGKKLKQSYPEGRQCAEPGCITILSQSTPGKYCRRHRAKRQREAVLSLRTNRRADLTGSGSREIGV